MNWDLIKDWLQILGVIVGGIIFTIKIAATLKADREKTELSIADLRDEIEKLKSSKVDATVMEISIENINKSNSELKSEMRDIRSDMKEGITELKNEFRLSKESIGRSMESVNNSLGTLSGTMEMFKQFFLKK